ncbi:MAG: SIMPL domain-containing protein [Micavibrio sp.]
MTSTLKFMALGLASLMLFGASPASAQNNGLNLPPAGQTIINFSATERRTVPQDLLVASLRIEVEKEGPKDIQKEINEAMTKALALAKAESALKVSTGNYSVYKYEHPIKRSQDGTVEKTATMWRGSQTIELQSKDSETLLTVVGKIQELDFAMNNLSYTLSPELTEKIRDELMVEALKKLTAKAKVVAATLGKANVDLVDVNVDTGGPVVPMYKNVMARSGMAMAASEAMAAPVAEAGETDISLTVSARALIKP